MILHNGEPARCKVVHFGNRKNKPSADAAKRARGGGPGSIFSAIIFRLTGQESKRCMRCKSRMQQMNSWGWWRCWKNRKTILEWLSDEARRRGHDVSDSQLADLFRAAIKEAFGKRARL